MRVTVGVKGWNDQSGWHWTYDSVVEFDGHPQPIEPMEQEQIERAMDEQKAIILRNHEKWLGQRKEPAVPKAPETPKASNPADNPPKTPTQAPPAEKRPETPKAPAEPIDLTQLDILYKVKGRSEKNLKIVDNYLDAVGRMKLEDLSKTQATRLIDRIAKEGN